MRMCSSCLVLLPLCETMRDGWLPLGRNIAQILAACASLVRRVSIVILQRCLSVVSARFTLLAREPQRLSASEER